MNEFESVWISLSQSQSRVRMFLSESERKKQGVWIPKCRANSKIAEFQMATIIKLSQNEWVMFFLCKKAETKLGEFKMAAIIN